MMSDSYPGSLFFSQPDVSGNVYLLRSLKEDINSNDVYQLRYNVWCTDSPNSQSNLTVVVSVVRNPNAPEITGLPQSISISRTHPLTFPFFIVNATDVDGDSISFEFGSTATDSIRRSFYIYPQSGSIILQRSLELDTTNRYILPICAVDSRGRKTCSTLTVNVRSEQCPTPVFVDSLSVVETLPVDSVVHTVTTDISCQGDGEIRYKPLSRQYPAPGFFSVDSITGQIVVTRLMREDWDHTFVYILEIEAYCTNNPTCVGKREIQVRPLRNPNAPRLNQSLFESTILDNHDASIAVVFVGASDSDNDTLTYSIVTEDSDVHRYFYIDEHTGKIYLRSPLKGLERQNFTFKVKVEDETYPVKSDEADVIIRVSADRHPPQFTRFCESPTVLETSSKGERVCEVEAIDRDLIGRIEYRIVGFPPGSDLFDIGSTSGVITVNESLYYEQQFSYQLVIEAFDTVYPDNKVIDQATINVRRNTHAPVFNPVDYVTRVSDEHLPVGTLINVTVSASDRDDRLTLKGQYEYSIDPSSAGAEYFYIQPSTGVISIAKILSSDDRLTYFLAILATDKGTPAQTGRATVTITVVRNINCPVFQTTSPSYDVAVESTGTTLFVVSAVDADAGRNGIVSYRIVPRESSQSLFQIDRDSGAVSLTNVISQDMINTTVSVTVEALDGGNPPCVKQQVISVMFTDGSGIRMPPEYIVNHDEALNPGSDIITVAAVSQSPPITYRLLPDATYNSYFAMESATGRIFLRQRFTTDDSNTLQYDLLVTARDNTGATATTRVKVIVTRNSFAPVFIQSQNVSIYRQNPINQPLTRVIATDGDRVGTDSARIRYSLSFEQSEPLTSISYFQINERNGDISLFRSLVEDVSLTSVYKLYVLASDQGVPVKSDATIVSVSIKDNRAPSFSQSVYEATVVERLGIGEVVRSVSAADPDGDDVTYSILDSTDSRKFKIDTARGVIQIAGVLYTDTNDYNITVVATDSGMPSMSAYVNVYITVTRNFNKPYFTTNYTRSISEYAAIGQQVLSVVAYDDDPSYSPSGQLSYELVPGLTQGAETYFRIGTVEDAGLISVNRSLREFPGRDMQFRVLVRDGGAPSKTAVAFVHIRILGNEHSPRFTLTNYTATISESHLIGQVVLTVKALDDDRIDQGQTANSFLTYSIRDTETSADATRYFAMEKDTGVLTVKRSLKSNIFSPEFYSFEVDVYDEGLPQRSATASIYIDVRKDLSLDYGIGFDSRFYRWQVSENGSVSRDMAVINSNGRAFICELVNAPNGFSIEEDVGLELCRLAHPGLDFEAVEVVSLTARVRLQHQSFSDQSGPGYHPQTTIDISVVDINDNKPYFIYTPNPAYSQYLSIVSVDPEGYESLPQTCLTQLKAMDDDSGVNGEVAYQLTFVSDESLFAIDEDSDCLKNIKYISDDGDNYFNIEITALDGGSPSLSTKGSVRMFKIREENRMVLVLNQAELSAEEIESYRLLLQKIIGKDVIIEKVSASSQLVNNGSALSFNKRQTDLTFTCVEKSLDRLCTYSDNVGSTIDLDSAKKEFDAETGVSVIGLHKPYRATSTFTVITPKPVVSGSVSGDYYGLMAWWPFLLLAALILALALLGIFLLLCCAQKWRRHYKAGMYSANLATAQRNGYGFEHGSAYSESVIVKSKDLEEQSLCMYVPPEGNNELGEINFAFSEAALAQTQQGAAQTATVGMTNGHAGKGGREETEEIQQSYSEYHHTDEADGRFHGDGHFDAVDTATRGQHVSNSTLGRSSGGFIGGGTAHRSGTMTRTDVIVDGLGAHSMHGSGYGTTTVEEQTVTHNDGYEEQEHNMKFY